ncbi:Fibrocystin [Frankliniella fusca]|uniref:Fibrocystin n=1 Tax=Frankliniella fusca TaxID=407009 RepID=A0AAE1HY78_9NEOP|nr:Fibrocystin [Frankliniella fusca]
MAQGLSLPPSLNERTREFIQRAWLYTRHPRLSSTSGDVVVEIERWDSVDDLSYGLLLEQLAYVARKFRSEARSSYVTREGRKLIAEANGDIIKHHSTPQGTGRVQLYLSSARFSPGSLIFSLQSFLSACASAESETYGCHHKALIATLAVSGEASGRHSQSLAEQFASAASFSTENPPTRDPEGGGPAGEDEHIYENTPSIAGLLNPERFSEIAKSGVRSGALDNLCALARVDTSDVSTELATFSKAYPDLIKNIQADFRPSPNLAALDVDFQVSCERCFSKLKIMKTRLRNSMSDDFLRSSMIISVEREICEDLQREDILQKYALSSLELSRLLLY